MPAAKIIAGVAALAVIPGGYYLTKKLNDSWESSRWRSISWQDPETYDANSIGRKYSLYFLSSSTNKKFWEGIYKKHISKFAGPAPEGVTKEANKEAKDKFGTVTEAYSNETDNKTALNKVCDSLYKQTSNDNLSDEEPTEKNVDKYTRSNAWDFCSMGIVTIKDNSAYGGVDAESKKIMVSTKDKTNDWFWDLQTPAFHTKKNHPGLGLEFKENTVFKTFAEDFTKGTNNVKEVCEDAYKQTPFTGETKSLAEKVCSIKLDVTFSPIW